MNKKGVSIIGTIFTLIVLGVLGSALVAIVATDQESRMKSIFRERAFYSVQTGFEWALREIKEGGYPIVSAKPIGEGKFTVTIDPAPRRITVAGTSGTAVKTYSITTNLLGKDCLQINTAGATVGGATFNQLLGLSMTKNCLNAVSAEGLTLTWSPDSAEKMRRVRIGGIDVYNDLNGVSSGQKADITDVKVSGSAVIDVIEFSSSIVGKTMNLKVTCTDSSEVTSANMAL